MRKILVIFSLTLLLGCSEMSNSSVTKSMDLHLGETPYHELVDFMYDFANHRRLTVLWFGWYQVDNAIVWYERSDENSNFKIKLELLTEKNGYIVVTNGFDEKTANVVIDYGDEKAVWVGIVDDFKNEVTSRDWKLKSL